MPAKIQGFHVTHSLEIRKICSESGPVIQMQENFYMRILTAQVVNLKHNKFDDDSGFKAKKDNFGWYPI